MDSELPTLFYFVFFFSSYCVLDVSMHLEATFLHFRAFSRRFLPKVTYSNWYIHSHTDGGGCLARFQAALQEQHFDMQTGGFEPATFRKQDTSRSYQQVLLRNSAVRILTITDESEAGLGKTTVSRHNIWILVGFLLMCMKSH